MYFVVLYFVIEFILVSSNSCFTCSITSCTLLLHWFCYYCTPILYPYWWCACIWRMTFFSVEIHVQLEMLVFVRIIIIHIIIIICNVHSIDVTLIHSIVMVIMVNLNCYMKWLLHLINIMTENLLWANQHCSTFLAILKIRSTGAECECVYTHTHTQLSVCIHTLTLSSSRVNVLNWHTFLSQISTHLKYVILTH